ncbi:ABC transporter six-transmembrane domain-containing protein [Aeromonas sp. FDAARGOS 1419]|uniref:ABC transporter six-transmembrane domain-containing protein n=1 Tax=Aeromonas sp. FDAARGOS 1419 TaxID=2778068 RepID=UPI001C223CEC|nr:ABC transporter six-transmembrane domain-containing protein [Aeromonas sp. FDAARGOS 1419]QWZ77408.1 ABC transporter six-transmembrane domain-containing protein [Aeromonas sp. FDAARGOS 1419]
MTTPTTSAASCNEQATPLPHSAGRSLGAIARANPLKLAGTFSLVALENILLVAYPLFAGFAIDAIVKGQWLQASSYALIVLLFWLIGALRRAVDTRTFTHIYAALAVPVILTQRQQQEGQSTIVARVTLAREFVDFFEKHIPILATSLISIVGAAVMLMVIEFWVGIACMGVLLLFGLLLPGFSRKNQLLHERLNDRLEHEVKLVTHAQSASLSRHYRALAWIRIRISDRETLAFLAVGISASLLFLLAITMLMAQPQVSAGHVYAVMTYLWNFVTSLDEGPGLADQLARLRDIGRRVNTAQPDELI